MNDLLHFISIFASIALMALAFSIIQVMIGTYRDRIWSALVGSDMVRQKPVMRHAIQRRSLLLSRA